MIDTEKEDKMGACTHHDFDWEDTKRQFVCKKCGYVLWGYDDL